MECEICGEEIYGKGLDIVIDGAKLKVCSECAHHGIAASQIPTQKQKIREVERSGTTPQLRPHPSIIRDKKVVNDDLEVVENFSSLIRKSREQMHFTHMDLSRKVGEKISILQKLETGKILPDQALARKLEYTLKIKLLQASSKISTNEDFAKKPSDLTLGDVVFMRRNETKIQGKKEDEQ